MPHCKPFGERLTTTACLLGAISRAVEIRERASGATRAPADPPSERLGQISSASDTTERLERATRASDSGRSP